MQSEGYGLSRIAVDQAIERGASLIVTADCGISATEAVAEDVVGSTENFTISCTAPVISGGTGTYEISEDNTPTTFNDVKPNLSVSQTYEMECGPQSYLKIRDFMYSAKQDDINSYSC